MPSSETIPQLERRLERLTKARPDLGEAADFQAALVRESVGAVREPEAKGFPLPGQRLAAKVRQGIPILHGEPASVDVHYAADLFGRIVNRLAERDDPETRDRVQAIVDAATENRLDPERLFTEAFVQHRDHVWELASLAGVDADLLNTIAALSVAPLLRAYAERLVPLLERADDGTPDGAAWQKGYCPVCGAWPALAELRGVELRRFLRCSACGSAWPARRLFCPYCGNDDFKSLSHLRAEGEGRFRVDTCQRCNGYLKSANAFDPAPPELLPLEDLTSVDLDVAAIEAGFHRPADAGFRVELALPEEAWGEALADLD